MVLALNNGLTMEETIRAGSEKLTEEDCDESDSGFTDDVPKLVKHKSWVWHFGKLSFHKRDGARDARWNCNFCDDTYISRSTTWIRQHLHHKHDKIKQKLHVPIVPKMVETDAAPTVKDMVEASGRKQIVNLAEFQRNLTTWLTVSRQAFTAVQEPVFCEMIANLNKTAAQMLPSGNTARSWVVNEFNRQKKYLAERLRLARSRVHLSFDLWTAPAGNRSYLGVVAHWVDHANFDIGNLLIALPALEDRQTGENITNCLINVAQDYGFGHKVGYCMGDSASNNGTAAIALQPLLTSKFGPTAGVFQPSECQLCCFGHQLNLGAKQLLFGHDVKAIEAHDTNFINEKAEEEEFKHWRKVGGKCIISRSF